MFSSFFCIDLETKCFGIGNNKCSQNMSKHGSET